MRRGTARTGRLPFTDRGGRKKGGLSSSCVCVPSPLLPLLGLPPPRLQGGGHVPGRVPEHGRADHHRPAVRERADRDDAARGVGERDGGGGRGKEGGEGGVGGEERLGWGGRGVDGREGGEREGEVAPAAGGPSRAKLKKKKRRARRVLCPTLLTKHASQTM